MIKLENEDVKVLEIILKMLVAENQIRISELKDILLPKTSVADYDYMQKEQHLIYCIELFCYKYKLGELTGRLVDGHIDKIPIKTKRFIQNGGFKEQYNLQIKEEKDLELKKKGDRARNRLAINQQWGFWVTLSFAISSLAFSLYSIFCSD